MDDRILASRPGPPAGKPRRLRLSQRTDLPARVRHILTGLLGLCTRSLADSLVLALNGFEQELSRASWTRAAKPGRSGQDALREVRRTRAAVGPRFLEIIEDGLARLDQSGDALSSGDSRTAGALPTGELALVETEDLEATLALQEIAAKCEIRQSAQLHDLGNRFGVLGGQPAIDADHLPLGPARLLAALRHATADMDLAVEHRASLYRSYDHVVLAEIGTFYTALNAFLVEHRVLRHLRVHAPLRAKGKSGAPADEPRATPSAHDPGSSPSGERPPQGAPATGNAGGNDPELFSTLRDLLAGRRRATGARHAEMPGGRAYVPGAAEMQAVLGRLQSAPPGAASDHAVPRTPRQLKHELLEQLRQQAPPGAQPQLTGEDSDTIDLVGMLFDYMTKSAPSSGRTHAMLNQLQVPLLRVALRDKSFFTEGAHPARLLLNAVAETGIHWIDDNEGGSDPALLKKMHAVIERLNAEFDGDLSMIEGMFADLSQHMHTLAHKAEIAERRLVDASKGREKLALARETASSAVAERVARARPGRLLRTMLERAWTDVLALTLLRQGEKSEMYKKQLGVVDQLIDVGGASPTKSPMLLAALRQDVEKGLSQVGFHHDEIQAVITHLIAPDEAADDDDNASSPTQVAIQIKSKIHRGEAAEEEKPLRAAAARKAALQLNAAEEHELQRLQHLPFGTWFEFAVNQQGDRVQRKLSWYSTVTGRCLFVNARGARAYERTLEQLARDVVHGQASIAEPDGPSLVDRAWKAIVASLRQFTGGTVPA